eukprot:225827_1
MYIISWNAIKRGIISFKLIPYSAVSITFIIAIQLLFIFWHKCFVYSGSKVGNKSRLITHFNADVSFNKHRIDDVLITFIEWNQSQWFIVVRSLKINSIVCSLSVLCHCSVVSLYTTLK